MVSGDLQTQSEFGLLLDPSGLRRFAINSPLVITRAELRRIQEWVSWQLIVVADDALLPQPKGDAR